MNVFSWLSAKARLATYKGIFKEEVGEGNYKGRLAFVGEAIVQIVFLLRENDGDESSFNIPLCRWKSFKVLR